MIFITGVKWCSSPFRQLMYLIKDLNGYENNIWAGDKVGTQNAYDAYEFYDGTKWGETCNLETCNNVWECKHYNSYQITYNSYNDTMKAEKQQLLADKLQACNDAKTACKNNLIEKGLYLPKFLYFLETLYVVTDLILTKYWAHVIL